MSSFFGTLALAPLELALNRLIAHDAHTSERVSEFDGKVIEILVEGLAVCVIFRSAKIKLNLASSQELMRPADATLAGSAAALFGLATQPANKRALSNPALTVSGDAGLVQALYHLVSSLDLRLEDYLAPFMGDIVANEARRVSAELHDWREDGFSALTSSLDDYLAEEIRLVPTASEAVELRDGIDSMRLRLDRLEARLRQAEDESVANHETNAKSAK